MKHKKILSIFLTLMMLIAMLPKMTITTFAVEIIEEVAIEFEDMDVPIWDWEPMVVSRGSYVGQYVWDSEDYGTGILYTLTALVETEVGYKFDASTEIYVNGADIASIRGGAETIEITYEYYVEDEIVEHVAVEFEDSSAQVWKTEPIVVSPNAYVDQYVWNSETYSQGTVFILTALIKPEDGYKFDEQTVVRVDDEKVTSGDWQTEYIEITYEYYVMNETVKYVAVEFEDSSVPVGQREPIVVSTNAYVDQYVWNSETSSLGIRYILTTLVKPEVGYEFDKNTKVYVNGEEITWGDWSTQYIEINYEYYVIEPKTVTQMEITNLSLPIAGEMIDTAIATGEINYYRLDQNYGYGGVYWYDSDGFPVEEDYKFVAGETYQVELKIVPVLYNGVPACTFDSGLKVTANGVEPSQVYVAKDKVYVYFDFLCVEEEKEELTAVIKADYNVTEVNVGEEVIYRGLATGGTGDYTYKFAVLDVNTNKWTVLSDFSKKSELVYNADKAGKYQFAMTVKDSSGVTLSATRAELIVKEVKPLVGTLKVNNNTEKITVAAGTNLTLKANATGGSGVYTYKYALLNTKTGAWNVFKNFTAVDEQAYIIKTAGTYQFACTVKDNKGETVSANRVTVVVEEAKPLSATLKVNNSVDKITVKSGTDLTLTTTATGGSGNYTYKYAMLNLKTGVWSILKDFNASNTYVLSKVGAGSYQFAATVKDNVGKTVAAERVTVNVENSGEALKGTLKVNGSADKLTVSVGTDLTLTPEANGGDGNYTYKYAMLNTKTNVWTVFKDFSEAKEYIHRTRAEGTYEFACTVKDGSGKTVSANRVTVVVEKALEPLAGTLTVNGSKDKLTVAKGTKITLVANATGGSENYTYKFAVLNVDNGKWSVLKDFSSASTYTYALNYPGTKEFAVTIKDSKGATVATNRLTVVVK